MELLIGTPGGIFPEPPRPPLPVPVPVPVPPLPPPPPVPVPPPPVPVPPPPVPPPPWPPPPPAAPPPPAPPPPPPPCCGNAPNAFPEGLNDVNRIPGPPLTFDAREPSDANCACSPPRGPRGINLFIELGATKPRTS